MWSLCSWFRFFRDWDRQGLSGLAWVYHLLFVRRGRGTSSVLRRRRDLFLKGRAQCVITGRGSKCGQVKEKKNSITVSWLVWFGLVAKSCPTLTTPWTMACQAPLSVGFSREEYWSGLPFPLPGDLPNPGVEPGSPALQAGSLPAEPSGKPLV